MFTFIYFLFVYIFNEIIIYVFLLAGRFTPP